jgi:4-aminobutyrate aminotransferase
MAISGHPAQEGVAKAGGLTLVPYPNVFRDGGPEQASTRALAHIEEILAGPVPPEEVAAFFLEPIQSDGGMIVPPSDFFRSVEALCRRHGILVVSDEVKVGLGRSGLLHAFDHLGIEPDIVVFGKGLGGGLPISAAVGPAAIMNHRAAFSFQTVHGNPVCASAALAVLDTIDREKLPANAARVGSHMAMLLDGLKNRHPLIGDIRGRGLAVGVELVGEAMAPARLETAKVVYRAFELGLVLYYVGVNSNVLEMTPSLQLTIEEATTAVEILDQALTDVEAGRVSDDTVSRFAGW